MLKFCSKWLIWLKGGDFKRFREIESKFDPLYPTSFDNFERLGEIKSKFDPLLANFFSEK